MLEVNKQEEEKRPFKVTDRFRLFRKGIMAASLEDLILKGEPLLIFQLSRMSWGTRGTEKLSKFNYQLLGLSHVLQNESFKLLFCEAHVIRVECPLCG